MLSLKTGFGERNDEGQFTIGCTKRFILRKAVTPFFLYALVRLLLEPGKRSNKQNRLTRQTRDISMNKKLGSILPRTPSAAGYLSLFPFTLMLLAPSWGQGEGADAATWVAKTEMPGTRWGHSASLVDGKIYVFGGLGSVDKVDAYDPATDTWANKSDMLTGRYFTASVVADGKVYVMGGTSIPWSGLTGSPLATVEEYDPSTDTWTKKSDMLFRRDGLVAEVVNSKIYAIGGGIGTAMGKVEEYDPATDTWTEKADMPTPRKFHSSSVVNGKIYSFGGKADRSATGYKVVEVYHPPTDTWERLPDMPGVTVSPGMSTAVVDARMYSFGGHNSSLAPTSTLSLYEPSTDTWTVLEAMPFVSNLASTTAVGGSVYVIGGTADSWPFSTYLSSVWKFTPPVTILPPSIRVTGISMEGADRVRVAFSTTAATSLLNFLLESTDDLAGPWIEEEAATRPAEEGSYNFLHRRDMAEEQRFYRVRVRAK
jgi:N-acetylneuraminic acid mutarotase